MKQPPVLRAILKPTQQLQLRHWHTEDPGCVQFSVCIVGRSVSAAKMVWQLVTFEFQKHAQHHPPKCLGPFGLIKTQRDFCCLGFGEGTRCWCAMIQFKCANKSLVIDWPLVDNDYARCR